MKSTVSLLGVLAPAFLASALLAAPAAADMTSYDLQKPAFGSAYGTNCGYKVTLKVNTPNKVAMFESAQSGPSTKLAEASPSGNSASFVWVPKTEGVRHLSVGQEKGGNWVTTYWVVTVKKGLNLGSSCLVL